MDSIDLSFLSEDEVETIVNVIEMDFEVKANEKSRLCRLRKSLIKNDQKAAEVNKKTADVPYCVICFRRFLLLFNPKRSCCSCGLEICRHCCRYVRRFQNYICQLCQKQKDLMAMNCSWFYENIKRKFIDGGSQIIANCLSEYPRNNAISPEVLNMVKGTQVSKFRFQIDEATRTIEESLIKVELCLSSEETKASKYKELIDMFVEKLKLILRNTAQILYVTMENYLNKIGKSNTNIDMEVLNTLHEEVELRTGKQIDIRQCQKKLQKKKITQEELDNEDNLETILSTPILDQVLCDVQQALVETQGKTFDELNSTLRSMIKKEKNEFIDFDLDSVSQVPSRRSTIRRSKRLSSPRSTIVSIPKRPSPESPQSSKVYGLTLTKEKSLTISQQWNELLVSAPQEVINNLSATEETMDSPSLSVIVEDSGPTDSDALSMPLVTVSPQCNWLMTTRHPISSINSLLKESQYPRKPRLGVQSDLGRSRPPYSSRDDTTDNKAVLSDPDNSDYMEDIYQGNQSLLSDANDTDIDQEYRQNNRVLLSNDEEQCDDSRIFQLSRNSSNRSISSKQSNNSLYPKLSRESFDPKSVTSFQSVRTNQGVQLKRNTSNSSTSLKPSNIGLYRSSSRSSFDRKAVPSVDSEKIPDKNAQLKRDLSNRSLTLPQGNQGLYRSPTRATVDRRSFTSRDSITNPNKQVIQPSPSPPMKERNFEVSVIKDTVRNNRRSITPPISEPAPYKVIQPNQSPTIEERNFEDPVIKEMVKDDSRSITSLTSEPAPSTVIQPSQSPPMKERNFEVPVIKGMVRNDRGSITSYTSEPAPSKVDIPSPIVALEFEDRIRPANPIKPNVDLRETDSSEPIKPLTKMDKPSEKHSNPSIPNRNRKKTRNSETDEIIKMDDSNTQIIIPSRKSHVHFKEDDIHVSTTNSEQTPTKEIPNKDSEVVIRAKGVIKPPVPLRKSHLFRLSSTLPAPQVPKRKSQTQRELKTLSLHYDADSTEA